MVIDGHPVMLCGVRESKKRCQFCRDRQATRQCDAIVSRTLDGRQETCDRFMCWECVAARIGDGNGTAELCRDHAMLGLDDIVIPPPETTRGYSSHKTRPPITWPATREQLWAAGYQWKKTRPCRMCGRVIELHLTPKQQWMPLDHAEGKYEPHFATCEEYKRRQKDSGSGNL